MTQGMTFRQFIGELRRAPDRWVRIARLLCILATVLVTSGLWCLALALAVRAAWR